MIDPVWVVMPVLAGPVMTEAAISDLLAQSVPTRILVINQGVEDAFRDRLERLSEQDSRIFVWHHQPPLPSLSASWNLALDMIWQAGGTEALVVNNDVRLDADTVRILSKALFYDQALFVSAVGVTQEEFDARPSYAGMHGLSPKFFTENGPFVSRGGPDFSCFLISQACHQKYRFDERFIPAFCEDLDYHRRLLLAGDGSKIFSVNLPYLHLASQTLKQLPAPEAERIRGAIEHQSRAYYARKWGGPVNAERFAAPFLDDGGSCFNQGQVTTPELQRRVAAGLPPVGCAMHDDQPIDDCAICAREYAEYVEEERMQDDASTIWADSNQQEEERDPSAFHGITFHGIPIEETAYTPEGPDGETSGGSPAEQPADPTPGSD